MRRFLILALTVILPALVASQWEGQLFNYQLQTTINLQTDLIPVRFGPKVHAAAAVTQPSDQH